MLKISIFYGADPPGILVDFIMTRLEFPFFILLYFFWIKDTVATVGARRLWMFFFKKLFFNVLHCFLL